MWVYEKKMEYPVKIKKCNPRLAKLIISQYGGPDGELGASLRYLSQRYTMITPQAVATLNDIGTEGRIWRHGKASLRVNSGYARINADADRFI